jgi:hypothetical protein
MCHNPGFYQFLEWNFCFCFVVLIEISQGFKTFEVYLKLYYKTILNFLLFLEELLWESESFLNIILAKCVMFNKDCIFKTKFESWFQTLFYKSFLSDFKWLIFKTLILFESCMQKPFVQIIKFYSEFLF